MQDKFDAIVLSGGGAKGLLTLGALHYYHGKGVFDLEHALIYSGTSVGSVICLLLSIGCTPFEIFTKVYAIDHVFDLKKCDNIWEIVEKMGVLPIDVILDKIRPIVYQKLKQKYDWQKDDKYPTLKELKDLTGKTLIITVSNVTQIKGEYFSAETKPNVSCIDAIGYSCCLPIVFQRIKCDDCYVTDGALMDNLPLIPVDDGKIKILAIVIKGTDMSWPDDKFVGYFYRLMAILSRSSTELRCLTAKDNTTLVKINYTDISTFDFNISKEKKMKMFKHGFQVAKRHDEGYDEDISHNLEEKNILHIDSGVLHLNQCANMCLRNMIDGDVQVSQEDIEMDKIIFESIEKYRHPIKKVDVDSVDIVENNITSFEEYNNIIKNNIESDADAKKNVDNVTLNF